MKLIITESQLKTLISEQNDQYDPNKLYHRDKIVKTLSKGPNYIKQYIKKLPHLDCPNGTKNCTKIPQIVFQYIFGNF